MTLICFASQKGSPGTTAIALAVAAALKVPGGGRKLLLEADSTGGTLAIRYRLPVEPGLLTLAAAVRSGVDAEGLWRHTQELPGGLPVVVCPDGPEQVHAAMAASGAELGRFLNGLRDVHVICDVGRLGSDSPALPFVAEAAAVLMVARPTAEQLQPAARRLVTLKSQVRNLGWVLVGQKPYGPAEIEATYQFPVVGVVADDARSVASLERGVVSKRLRRHPFLRSSATLAGTLSGWLAPIAGAVEGDGFASSEPATPPAVGERTIAVEPQTAPAPSRNATGAVPSVVERDEFLESEAPPSASVSPADPEAPSPVSEPAPPPPPSLPPTSFAAPPDVSGGTAEPQPQAFEPPAPASQPSEPPAPPHSPVSPRPRSLGNDRSISPVPSTTHRAVTPPEPPQDRATSRPVEQGLAVDSEAEPVDLSAFPSPSDDPTPPRTGEPRGAGNDQPGVEAEAEFDVEDATDLGAGAEVTADADIPTVDGALIFGRDLNPEREYPPPAPLRPPPAFQARHRTEWPKPAGSHIQPQPTEVSPDWDPPSSTPAEHSDTDDAASADDTETGNGAVGVEEVDGRFDDDWDGSDFTVTADLSDIFGLPPATVTPVGPVPSGTVTTKPPMPPPSAESPSVTGDANESQKQAKRRVVPPSPFPHEEADADWAIS